MSVRMKLSSFLLILLTDLLALSPSGHHSACVAQIVDLAGENLAVNDPPLVPAEPLVSNGYRCQVTANYLRWWIKEGPIPGPLVTFGSLNDPRPGAMGMPGTQVLYGDAFDYNGNSGVRLNAEVWLNPSRALGLEVAGFFLETHTVHYEANSDASGNPVLARPFFNPLTGSEDAFVIAGPNQFRGGIDIFSDSRLWGAEVNGLGNWYRGLRGSVDWIVGFRYLGLKDDLRFSGGQTLLANGMVGFAGQVVLPPDIISITDRFHTHNQFFGPQLGLRGECQRGRWSLTTLGKIGLGSNYQELEVSGVTLRTNPGGQTQLVPGGLYTQATNLGRRNDGHFSWMSEVGCRLGFRLTDCCRFNVSYTFLYWDNVTRPGDQIDRAIDPRQTAVSLQYAPSPSVRHPVTLLRGEDDFWAQGFGLGLEFRY